MPVLINGSPTHALIVHAVVVLLPLSVLAALVLVLVPASRRAFALTGLLVAFLGCVAVPLAFLSGSALRQHVPASPLISHHVAVAHQLLPIAAVFGLAFAAFVAVDIQRRARRGELNQVEDAVITRWPRLVRPDATSVPVVAARVTGIVLVVLAVATAIAVVRVGDSGAKAVWHGRVSSAPQRP